MAIVRGSIRADIDFELVLDLNDDSKYKLVARLQNASLKMINMKTYFDSVEVQTETL